MDEMNYNEIHDCFVSVFDRVPTSQEVHFINDHLPEDIKLLAEKWGWNDTEVGDFVFRWIKVHIK